MTETSPSPSTAGRAPSTAEIDLSCRLPLLVLFISAAIWLVIASVFGLLASLTFHNPHLFADCSVLTYGHLRPAFTNSLLYGFCVQAGLGVGLWLIARLGQTTLAHRWLLTIGAKFWNLGVTAGIIGILLGDTTGFENLELPPYAALLCFIGYLVMGVWGVVTFHQRRERTLFVSQWFLFASIFWFPWIFSTANLLLVTFPVRGMAQAVIAWWYSDNLLTVWFGLVGFATVFYFVPKLTNRELHSHYLALFAFWTLILVGPWGGIPNAAAVPAWMPTTSTVATVLTLLPVIAVALNVFQTAVGPRPVPEPSLRFMLFGVGVLVLAALLKIAGVLLDPSQMLHFTWFTPARTGLHVYGFFVMLMFGAIYYIFPKLVGVELPYPKMMRWHFRFSAAGILAYALPLVIGGISQSAQLQDPKVSSVQLVQSSLPFLRFSTVGDLLLLIGSVAFLVNIGGLVSRFYRARMAAVYSVATADLFKSAEVKS
jgi:cytochrome c oxidase cbb3-type subunit 1